MTNLDSCRPRDVRLTTNGVALRVTSLVFLAGAIGLFFLLVNVSNRQSAEQQALEERGADVEAVVTRTWRTSGENNAWVAYRFSTDRGETYESRAKVPLRIWRRLAAGSRLTVRFDRTDPAFNKPAVARENPLPLWFAPLPSITLIFAGFMMSMPIRKQRELLVDGRSARGAVISHKKAGHHGVVVQYEFRILSGATRNGRSGPLRKPPSIGSTVSVLYDPENPNREALYPLALVRLAER